MLHAARPTMNCGLAALMVLILATPLAQGFIILRATNHHRLDSLSTNQHKRQQQEPKQEPQIPGNRSEGPRFVLLLDAGSTGTKLNLYEVFPEPRGPEDVVEVFPAVKVKPGLHTFAEKSEEELVRHVQDIDAALTAAIPREVVFAGGSPSVYLMATAGVRPLPKSTADGVMHRAWQQLRDIFPPSHYDFPESHTKVLTGEEEGMYAWLAANFLNGFFKDRSQSSVGLLEMGGSSLQVVFPPRDPAEATCQIRLPGQGLEGSRPLGLHARSYTGFGSLAIGDQVMDRLCASSSSSPETGNPCMLKEDTKTHSCGAKVGEKGFTGQSQPAQCSTELTAILGDSLPRVVEAGNVEFFAISGFRYAPKTLRAIDKVGAQKVLNVDRLETEAGLYCGKTVTDATALYGNEAKFASSDCIQGLFIAQLLTALDLHDNAITIHEKIHNKHLNWALGAALDMTVPDISFSCQPHSGKTL